MKRASAILTGLCLLLLLPYSLADARDRWTAQEANGWYAAQPWPLGSNYIPANAINQLEMWQADTFDPKRIDAELGWAQQLGIRPIFVLLDSCWDPRSTPGPQHPPIPGVHNCGWVQSPAAIELADPASYAKLRAYVEGVVGAFAKDPRILPNGSFAMTLEDCKA